MDLLSYLAEHFDLPILDWIAANLTSAFGDGFMSAVTHLGKSHIPHCFHTRLQLKAYARQVR